MSAAESHTIASTSLALRVADADPMRVAAAQVTLWAFLATVVMLFAGFTSAYLVRRSTGSDWSALSAPRILWLNTLVLAVSSLTLEATRHRARSRGGRAALPWLVATTALGLGFLGGQLAAWSELARQGLFLASNPHGSFFYVLTATHGLHLLGGIAALGFACVRSLRPAAPGRDLSRLGLSATYWHFVGALWLWVLAVLFLVG